MFVHFEGKNGERLRGEVIQSEPRLKKLVKKMHKISEFAFDTETNTLRAQAKGELYIVGISICFGKHDCYYIPTGHYFDKNQLDISLVIDYLTPIFERPDVRIIGHNLKFDRHVLACYDIDFKTKDLFDTMLASWLIDENELKGLKHLTSVVYGVAQEKFDACLATVTKEEKKQYGLKGNKKPPFQLVRIPIGAPYAMADAYWTWRHYCDWMMEQLEAEEMWKIYFKKMMPFSDTLYWMERRGVNVSKEKLLRMQEKATRDLEQLEYDIVELAEVEFKPSSDQQIGELLFGYKKFNKKGEYSGNKHLVDNNFGFPILEKTDGGAPATGASVLKAVTKLNFKKDKRKKQGVEMIKLILKFKKLSKLKSAFIDGLLNQIYDDGKIHPTFNLGGASSGRLSCSEPNLQQLPRPVEMDYFLNVDDWYKKSVKDSKIDYTLKEATIKGLQKYFDKFLEHDSEGYPTGSLKRIHEECKLKGFRDYMAYVKTWREKNEENIFWKFYEIRDCFIPDDPENESLIALDYSNLEMRLLTHFSEDPNLMETFLSNSDAHGGTAVNMFSLKCTANEAKKLYHALRQIAKTINFLLMYGGGATTLYKKLDEEDAVDENGDPITLEKAKEYYSLYFEKYEGVSAFIKDQKKFAHKYEQVFTVLGRKRRLPDINGRDYKTVAYQERLSVNACIQGSGADIMMCVQPIVEACERLKELGCTMRLQVHDELVFNCPDKHVAEATQIIKDLMEHPFPKPLNLPLRVDADFGKSYSEAK